MDDVNWNGLKEYFNDALFTSILLEIYNKMDVNYSKGYLADFVEYISSIFIFDLMQSKFGDGEKILKEDEQFLKKLRKNNLKISMKSHSKTLDKKIAEMGINFDVYTYDCAICYFNEELYDINYRNWNNDRKTQEYREFQYRLVYNCRTWLKRIFEWFGYDYNKFIDEILGVKIKEWAKKLEDKKLKMTSYSTNKLFDGSNLSNSDKMIIMQYYGCLKSILFFEKTIEKIEIKVSNGHLLFNSEYFFIKLKAVLIDTIFDALPEQESILYDELTKFTNENIPDDFWKTNRKIRRNIHYDDYEEVLDEEYKYVKKYQDIYLEELLKNWNRKINIKIGFWEKFFSFISKMITRNN